MPWPTPSQITLSTRQKQILTEMSVGTHTPLHFKIRAQIILHADAGWGNNRIEANMHIGPKTVKRWRDRYSSMQEELRQVETEAPHKLRKTIKKTLSDEQRPGGPPTYTDEQVAAIIAMACEDPAKFNLPFSHWTPSLLQAEVIKLGIAEGISVRQIGRFLKRTELTATPK
jgi:DNA-binding NarL/FixJ family response regulator